MVRSYMKIIYFLIDYYTGIFKIKSKFQNICIHHLSDLSKHCNPPVEKTQYTHFLQENWVRFIQMKR